MIPVELPLNIRERFRLAATLCIVHLQGIDEQDNPHYQLISILGHRLYQFTLYQARSPMNVTIFGADIIRSGLGEPTQDDFDFVAEKYLYGQERINVRIFPQDNPDKKFWLAAFENPQPQRVAFARIDWLRIGLIACFGIETREFIETIAYKLRLLSVRPDEPIVFSNKGE